MEENPLFLYQTHISIEGHGQDYKDAKSGSLFAGFCPFCHSACRAMRAVREFNHGVQYDTLAVCLRCGWWSFAANFPPQYNDAFHFSARAILQEFSVSEDHVDCEELAKCIAQQPESNWNISCKKLEELATAVYKNVLGYTIECVSYGRPDGGLFVLCTRSDAGLRAVRIKRYSRAVEITQIRHLVGAVMLEGQREALFVTTEQRRTGCHEVVSAADSFGFRIDLVTGKRLLEFIKVLSPGNNTMIRCSFWGTVGYGSGMRLFNPLTMDQIRNASSYVCESPYA
jgi:Restriction endonuclease